MRIKNKEINVDRIINTISDLEGRRIVVINDIRFKGKRNIDWEDVEQYLKEYIGDCYEVVETSDQVFIGSDFPGELASDGDLYLYDMVNIKKKRAPRLSNSCTVTNPFLISFREDFRRIQEDFILQDTPGTIPQIIL